MTRERWRPKLHRRIGSFNRAGELNGPNNILKLSDVCKSLNNELQNYSHSSDCVHGGEQSALDRPCSSREALPSSVQLVNDHWVLNTVQGYQMDFVSEPQQQSPFNPPYYLV